MQNITNGQFCIQVIYTRGMLQICSYCTDTNFAIFIIYRCQSCTLNSNKKKNITKKKKRFKKYERWELQASGRSHSSFCQSPAVPFAFPMLRCTAPKEWTLHRTATTSPPWPLCCLLYCSVLACLRHDYLCRREERKRFMLVRFISRVILAKLHL